MTLLASLLLLKRRPGHPRARAASCCFRALGRQLPSVVSHKHLAVLRGSRAGQAPPLRRFGCSDFLSSFLGLNTRTTSCRRDNRAGARIESRAAGGSAIVGANYLSEAAMGCDCLPAGVGNSLY